MERKNSILASVFLLLTLILSSQSQLVIKCKMQRNSCNVDKSIKIPDSKISITAIKKPSNAIIKSFIITNANVNFLPLKIGEKFNELETLKVHNSNLTAISKENFERLENLKELNLEKNHLTNLDVNVFQDLKSLQKIFLGHNQISSLPSKVFAFNINLTEISLEYNQIKELPVDTFKGLLKLEIIYLTSNKLEKLEVGTFNENKELKKIFLNNNSLEVIPEDIFNNNLNLEYDTKYFADNKCIKNDITISSRDDLPELFENCKLKADCTTEKDTKIKAYQLVFNDYHQREVSTNKTLRTCEKERKKLSEEKVHDEKALKDKIDELEKKVVALKEEKLEFSTQIANKTREIEEQNEIIKNLNEKISEKLVLNKTIQNLWIECDRDLEKAKTEITKIETINGTVNELTNELTMVQKKLEEETKKYENVTRQKETLDDALKLLSGKSNLKIEDLKNIKCDPSNDAIPKPTVDIACNFTSLKYENVGEYYSCAVQEFHSMDCGTIFGELQGVHKESKDVSMVSGISIDSSSFIEFPSKIFDKSPMKFVKIHDSSLGKVQKICDPNTNYLIISKSFLGGSSMEVKNCENLLHLSVESSNLKEISLENLRHLTDLSLKQNEIEKIPENFFDSMENLKNLQMSKNKISSLSSKIFNKNLKLEVINFSENPLKLIEVEIFKNKNFVKIDFFNSNCISKRIEKMEELAGLKKEIKEKCKSI